MLHSSIFTNIIHVLTKKKEVVKQNEETMNKLIFDS